MTYHQNTVYFKLGFKALIKLIHFKLIYPYLNAILINYKVGISKFMYIYNTSICYLNILQYVHKSYFLATMNIKKSKTIK